MHQTLIPILMVLCFSACRASESGMQSPSSGGSGLQRVAQDRGLAHLNPAPTQPYQVVLTIEGAPGPFAVVEGRAQYDVVNEGECGLINRLSGTAGRITSNEPFVFNRVSDGEYRGVVYLDGMLDEDLYGRGVCRWELTDVRASMRATGTKGETRFVPSISAKEIVAGESTTLHFWNGGYPRSEMDDYPDFGRTDPNRFRPELHGELFRMTLQAQGMSHDHAERALRAAGE